MKTKFSLVFILFSKFIFGQETNDKIVFLDSLSNETAQDNYYFKRVIKDFAIDKSEYKYLDYYKNGKLKSEKTLSGKDGGYHIGEEIEYYENGTKKSFNFYENKKLTGAHKFWYENGNLMEEGTYSNDDSTNKTFYKLMNFWNKNGVQTIVDGNGFYDNSSNDFKEKGIYKNGFKDGKWTGENAKSTFSFEEIYENGKLISGFSLEKDGTRNEYTELEVKPEPKKGIKDFYKYIGKNFRYTKDAEKLNIKGKIILSFVVDKEGKITEIKIVRGIGYGLDEEAIRVLSNYENWYPALQKGRKVRCSYMIPLTLNGIE